MFGRHAWRNPYKEKMSKHFVIGMARKRRIFDDDDFFGFDREFERMREEMERLMEEMMVRIPEPDLEKLAKQQKSGVYGLSIRIGPDGKPVVREFGNMTPEAGKEEKIPISDEREPLVDVIEGEKEITVIAEVPGVEKKDIRISGGGKELEIRVETANRKYHKVLELPSRADFGKAKAAYNNGVLEIVIPKGGGKESKKIEIG